MSFCKLSKTIETDLALHMITRYAGIVLPRKEVIHPHLPVRIPCYDLTPIISPTLGRGKAHTSGIGDFHGLTGGVYKTRERIHGSVLTYRY